MNTFALADIEQESVVAIQSMAGRKPVQRILQPELSKLSNNSRMADPDIEMVLQSQQGNQEAFEVLIRNHQRMIHALTFRMTGSMADAEDLAQETFLRAYEQIGSFRNKSKFSTWLYRIALNTCLNWLQSETRRARLQSGCAEELSAIHGQGDSAPQPGPDIPNIQKALLKLSVKQRAAITLTICDGFNHAEAAAILGCPETTVSWRVFAAKQKLKRWLSQMEVPHE